MCIFVAPQKGVWTSIPYCMKEHLDSDKISRKSALKKMGYAAFTVGTMMTVLKGSAQTNDWGNWDEENAQNGYKKSTSLSTDTEGPAASPAV